MLWFLFFPFFILFLLLLSIQDCFGTFFGYGQWVGEIPKFFQGDADGINLTVEFKTLALFSVMEALVCRKNNVRASNVVRDRIGNNRKGNNGH